MRHSRLLAGLAALGLTLAACGGVNDAGTDDADSDTTEAATSEAGSTEATTDGGDAGSGGPITVGGFNFPESTILGEIYAQALEGNGFEVERQLDAGTRELLLPEVRSGNVDVVPEYLGSLVATGYGETPETDPQAALDQATELVAQDDLVLLEPAEAENKNVFVVTTQWSEDNGVTALPDLADAGDVTLAGGPECEDRETCYAGLSTVYGLDNVSFTTIQEKSPRLAALNSGQVQMILLFSTDPVFEDGTLTILDDPENLSPPENIIPLVRQDTLEANSGMGEVLNEVSGALTIDGLTSLNGQAALGEQPADIAAQWLQDERITE